MRIFQHLLDLARLIVFWVLHNLSSVVSNPFQSANVLSFSEDPSATTARNTGVFL